jgi:hypothetical protein
MSNILKTLAAGSASEPTDEYFNQTTLLLHGDGTNGAQNNTFLDSSTNNFTITRNGNTTQGSFSPFSRSSGNLVSAPYDPAVHGGSGYFDGTGDYLAVANDNVFDTNSTFTLECWYYQSASGNASLFTRGGGAGSWSTSNGHQFLLFIESGNLYWMWNNAGSPVSISATPPPANQWNHLAIGYDGTTTRFWVNGVSVGTSGTGYTLPTTRNRVSIGINPDLSTYPMNGNVGSLRFVKGTDVYGVGNASITVPTAPLTAITNTELLTNFTNAGIFDNTGKNNLETVGNAQIDTTVKKYGTGSMEFDGTGDRLVIPYTNNFLDLGISGEPFTIEAWIYPTNTMASSGQIISKGGGTASWATTSGAQYQWTITSSALSWNFNSGGSPIGVNSGSVTLNAWQHVAVTYDGSTTRTFLNGVQQNTSASSYTAPTTRNLQYIGMTQSGGFTQAYIGYIDDLRITKGVARYTTTFTPPDRAFPDQ